MLKAYTRLTDRYKHEHNRLKFAISKDQRDETLSEIHAKIKKLERILAASDQVAAFEEPSKLGVSRQSVNNLMGYWRHADRIFALLLSSWGCPCRQTHCAHLWLQHRTSAHFEFRMLVMFAPANSNSSQVAPWRQHGLKIEWASLNDPVASKIVATALMPPPQKVVLPSAIAGQRVKSGILSRLNKANRPAKPSIRYIKFWAPAFRWLLTDLQVRGLTQISENHTAREPSRIRLCVTSLRATFEKEQTFHSRHIKSTAGSNCGISGRDQESLPYHGVVRHAERVPWNACWLGSRRPISSELSA
jgi:hypothetical protein